MLVDTSAEELATAAAVLLGVSMCGCFHCAGQDDVFDGSQPRPQLDFDSMPATFLVKPGGVLSFDNVMLSNIAPTFAYKYTPWAPWRNAGVGYALWPSIILSENGTVGQSRVHYIMFVSAALHPSNDCIVL
jgi:hypothetical protein